MQQVKKLLNNFDERWIKMRCDIQRNDTQMQKNDISRFCTLLLMVFSVLVFCSSGAYAYDGPSPKIFDFCVSPDHYGTWLSPGLDEYGFYDPVQDPLRNLITPVPRPGSYTDWDDSRITTLYDRVLASRRPLAIYLGPFTWPLGNNSEYENKDPQALSKSMNYLSNLISPTGEPGRLDYVFMDFEPVWTSTVNDNVAETVNQVRSHANPSINQAKVGNYDYFPCSTVSWGKSPTDNVLRQQKANSSYSSTGVNVAMPALYPWEWYEVHTDSNKWGSNVAPNERSALFWAPLEKLSETKRQLPAGHELIPYVNDMVQYIDDNYHADPPTKEDNAASLQHYRLRGADGYYVWETYSRHEMEDGSVCTYDYGLEGNYLYRDDMLEAWTSLDWLFDGATSKSILNLDTNKTSGFQWSAVETNRGGAVLLSNLGNSSIYFASSELQTAGMSQKCLDNLGLGSGLSVSAGDHLLLMTEPPSPPAVHYTFKETAPGTWEVLVEVTGMDTAGLSAYEIWVDGVDPATVSFDENVLGTVVGSKAVGFFSLIQGDVGGSFNAGNYQGSGDAAIQGTGMIDIEVVGSVTVDLDAQVLLGILSTEAGLTESNFRATIAGLLNSTGDGFYDSRDLIATYDVIQFVFLLGDANGDGVVSAGDYASVQANFGNTGLAGGGLPGDANGDGVVSAGDYAAVQANFGNTKASVVTPEPATLSLLVLGGLGMLRYKRK